MGCRPETFSGLTGMGDLIVTCASMHSRNRRCGILLGEGKSLEEAQKAAQARLDSMTPEERMKAQEDVRKMAEAVGHKVISLRRVGFGPVLLGDLPTGMWRPLTKEEIDKLKEL